MMMLEVWHINGRITQVADMFQSDMPVPVRVDTGIAPGDLAASHYVRVQAEIVERPMMDVPPVVSGVVGETVSFALPDPCDVAIGTKTARITGGRFEMVASAADTYSAYLSAWPYRDAVVSIVIAEAPPPDGGGVIDGV